MVLPVGSTPAGNGKWGHADLAGNVWQWLFDWYAPYSGSATNDYANTTPASKRIARGSTFGYLATFLPAATRNSRDPAQDGSSFGLRCARTWQ